MGVTKKTFFPGSKDTKKDDEKTGSITASKSLTASDLKSLLAKKKAEARAKETSPQSLSPSRMPADKKKLLLIETLWEIVLSDGQIHDYESSLIRRLSGLLYISDVNSGNAKKRALNKTISN